MTVSTPNNKELKAQWKNEVEVKSVSKAEVAKHKTKSDCWIIIHGKVYDVTKYSRDHPGGPDALYEVGGQDATSAYEDVGHSEDAREIMHAYLVGVLEGAQQEDSGAAKPASTPNTQVVKRKPESQPPSSSSGLVSAAKNHSIELGACAIGAVGLAFIGNYLLHHHSLSGMPGVPGMQSQSASAAFTKGFLTASIAVAAAGVMGAQYFKKMSDFGSGFEGYAPHIKGADRALGKFRPAGVLTPVDYQQFKLTQKEEVAKGIYKFVFDLPSKYSILGLPIGQHVAIRGQCGDHTVVRSYTPVSNNRDLGRLELIIRVYPDGQLGNFLKNLNLGDFADIRGPKGAMRYRKGMVKHIGMVGGGTGITPLYQIIRAICEDKTDTTTVSVIYGNRSEGDIMLKEKLNTFANMASEKFKILYILDSPPAGWTGGKGYVTKDLLSEWMPKPSKDSQILLCGPPGKRALNASLLDS